MKYIVLLLNSLLLSVTATAAADMTPAVPSRETPGVVKQELHVAQAKGMQSFGKGARFTGKFVQAADAPIVIEAEMAEDISSQQGNSVERDPQAFGGGFLHYADRASYRFSVTTPGKYVLWEHVSFPSMGSWMHYEGMDGSTGVLVMDGTFGPEKGWFWNKAGEYQLRAGEHLLNFSSFQNGEQLDALVFSRDNTPPGDIAQLKSSYRGSTEGEIWTTPVKPFDVAQWRQAQLDLPDTVETHCEYSADLGKTWTAFDPASDLTKLPVTGGGKDSLQFHIKAHSRDGVSPFLFGAGTLTYQAGPNDSRVVENGRMKVELDPYGIKSIWDKKTGEMIASAASLHEALAIFKMKKPGPSPTFTRDLYDGTLEKCEIGGSPDSPVLTMLHQLDTGLQVTTTVKLFPNGQSEWQMAIENPTEFEVAEFRFPIVTGIKLGGDPTDNWLFTPQGWKQETKDPAKDQHLLTTNSNQSTPMRWTAMWNDKVGIYLGIEDPRHEDYAFIYGGDSSGGTTLSPWQRTLVKPHSQWTSAVYRIAVTGGDWHEAADIYRDYTSRTLKPTDVAPFVKWLVDAWCLQPSNAAPFNGWDMLDGGSEPLMAANRQMLDGADSCYTGLYPLPCLAWGSIREFSQKLAVRRALGELYTPYHNFHLWAPGYGHYKRIGTFPKSKIPAGYPIPDDAWYAKAAEKNYLGEYERAETDPFVQCYMAMASPEWRNWLAGWTSRYIDWGTDGMYYDQFNMMYANGQLYPGFDTYGSWMPAQLDVISKIRQASRAKDPYYTSSGELCNDVYGQYLDLHMTSAVWNRLEFFRYAVPNQLLIDGEWNGGEDPSKRGPFGKDRERFIWQVGARFDHEPVVTGILSLRRAVKSLLYDATFRDTVGVTMRDAAGNPISIPYDPTIQWAAAPVDGVIGRWFLYNRDGQHGAIVNLINAPVQKGATCEINTKEFGPVNSALAVTIDGTWLPITGKQDGDIFTFPVPEAECSSVILAGKLAPLVEWTFDPAAAPGVTRTFKLKLTNANAEPLSGTVQPRLPQGWETPAPVAFGPIASGQSQSITVPVNVPAGAAKGRTDVWCDIATPAGNFAAYAMIAINDPVLVDFRGDPGTYHVWLKNLTTTPLNATVHVAARDGLKVSAPETVAVPAESEISLPVTVEGRDKLREISEMSASVEVGSQKLEVVRAVMPNVPNGNFEMDSAGDRKPDWWMSRDAASNWTYGRLHLATGAHGGKYCLQLDPPQGDEKFIRANPVDGAFRSGAHYRVSIWIKGASATGVNANIGGVPLGDGKTGPEWKQFTGEFTADSVGPYIGFENGSSKTAFFDDLVIEEVPAP